MSKKVKHKTNKKKHNRMTGVFSARLLQRWPNHRSWHGNPMRPWRKKLVMRGVGSDALRK
jgi:hypothetical protein